MMMHLVSRVLNIRLLALFLTVIPPLPNQHVEYVLHSHNGPCEVKMEAGPNFECRSVRDPHEIQTYDMGCKGIIIHYDPACVELDIVREKAK